MACSQASKTNVLLITVDTLRADHLGCYGYGRDTSPHLDAFARESLLFEHAYSQAPFTAPAHASLFTSLHTLSHGVLFWGMQLDPRARTMAERFQAAGYATGAFYNHPGLTPQMGLLRGFDTVELEYTRPAGDSVDNLLGWIDAQRAADRNFCAWLHLWDVHRPYGWRDWSTLPDSAPAEARREPLKLAYEEQRFGSGPAEVGRGEQFYNLNGLERARPISSAGKARVLGERDWRYIADRYDGGIWYADQELGRLFEGLAQRGLLDSSAIALTSDHGEALTEREACFFTHDPFLFDEVLHVPLVLRLPGGARGGQRLQALARDVDVLPTLLELADLAPLSSDQGRSLLPLARGAFLDPIVVFAQTQTRSAKESDRKVDQAQPLGTAWLEQRQALFDGRWKLIVDLESGSKTLFDLQTDPKETHDLAADPAARAELERLSHQHRALCDSLPKAGSSSLELSPADRELMQALGYMGEEQERPAETPAGSH